MMATEAAVAPMQEQHYDEGEMQEEEEVSC